MAKFKIKPTVDISGHFSAKLKGAVTDADVGKAVKLSTDTTDTYELCADGDTIDAFIVAIDPATADGLKFATLNNKGYVRCEADGAANVGGFVAAAAQAAIGTAEGNKLPKVSAHTPLVGEPAMWRIVSANTANGVVATGDTTVIVERV